MIKQFSKIFSLMNRKQKKKAIYIFFLMLIAMILEIFSISLLVPLLTSIITPDAILFKNIISFDEMGISSHKLIIYIVIIFTLIYALKTIFLIYFNWHQSKFVFDTQHFLSKKLFDIYLKQSYLFHIKNNSAQLLRNTTSEVGAYTSAISHLSVFLSESLIFLGIFILAIYLQPLITILVFIFFFFISAFYYLLVKNITLRWGIKRQYNEGMGIQSLQQGLSDIQGIKVFNKENFFVKKYELYNKNFTKMSQYINFISTLPRQFLLYLY